ncbi:MAG TPA: hypothetical protein VGH54_15625 [Mycobacterium sp.]
MDQSAKDLATSYPGRRQVGDRGCDAAAVRSPQVPPPVRAMVVIVRDVLLQDRPQVRCRRNTATSWRSTSNSASLEAAERASSAIQPAKRKKIR